MEPEALARFVGLHLGATVVAAAAIPGGRHSVFGLTLANGSEVVAKLHPASDTGHLRAVGRFQRHLYQRRFPVPEPLFGPLPIDAETLMVEAMCRGNRRDPTESGYLGATVAGLAETVELARSQRFDRGLTPRLLPAWRSKALWPEGTVQHHPDPIVESQLAWITEIGRSTKAIAAAGPPPGDPAMLAGHRDWRSDHLGFGHEGLSAVYDWESLDAADEPVIVAVAAHMYAADRAEAMLGLPVRVADAERFVSEYCRTTGWTPSASDRLRLAAVQIYLMAWLVRRLFDGAMSRSGGRFPAHEFRGWAQSTELDQAGRRLLDQARRHAPRG